MKLRVLILAVLFNGLLVSNSNAQIDTLWQKASNIATKNWNIIPGKTHKVKHVTDVDGDISGHKEITATHFLLDNNHLGHKLILAMINGDKGDETNDYVKSSLDDIKIPVNKSLFHNNLPGNPEISKSGKTTVINGHLCIGFNFIFESIEDEDTYDIEGIAWLDKTTGAPMLVEKTVISPPIMTKYLKIIEEYNYDKNYWYKIKETVLSEASLLWIRRKIEVTTSYYEHWEFPIDSK